MMDAHPSYPDIVTALWWISGCFGLAILSMAGYIFFGLVKRLDKSESRIGKNTETIGEMGADVRGLRDDMKEVDKHVEEVGKIELITTIATMKENHAGLDSKVNAIDKSVTEGEKATRQSLHEIRTLIGTQYATREELQKLTETVAAKLDRMNHQMTVEMPKQVTENIRQMLNDMGVRRRSDD